MRSMLHKNAVFKIDKFIDFLKKIQTSNKFGKIV